MVQGEALKVGSRELRPLVRVASWVKGGSMQEGACGGGGFVQMRPLAIIEAGPEGTRRIPVPDLTCTAIRCMACASLLSFLVWAVMEVWRGLKGGRADGTG